MRTTLGRGSRRGAVLLVLGALFLLPGSALAAKPKPGHYSGTTEQGSPIGFEVQKKGKKKRKARNLDYTVEAPCESGSAVDAGGLIPFSDKISKKGKFSLGVFLDFTVEVEGKFTSKTRARGTLRYTVLTGLHGYCDSGAVSWQVQRD